MTPGKISLCPVAGWTTRALTRTPLRTCGGGKSSGRCAGPSASTNEYVWLACAAMVSILVGGDDDDDDV